MKRTRRIVVLMMVVFALFMGVGITANASPKFNKKSVSVKKKKTTKLTVTGLSKKQKKKKWKFSTSDKTVATVKRKSKKVCKIAGKKDGYAVIKAVQGKSVVYALVKVGKGAAPNATTKSWANKARIQIPSAKKPIKKSVDNSNNNIPNDNGIITPTITSISTSPSYVTIKIGETQQVVAQAWNSDYTKITSGFTWSSADTSIATVDQNGRITGKDVGSTKVYCSLGGKTDEISVTIERDFDETTAARSISYTSYAVDGGVIVIAKNNYKYGVDLVMTCLYRSASGAMLGIEKDYNYWLEPGRECALFAYDKFNNYLQSASSYEISFKATDSMSMISNAGGISVTSNIGQNGVMVQAKNLGRTISYTDIAVVFMMDGNPVGYDSTTTEECGRSGSTAYLELWKPFDSNLDDIPYNGYKVYVNSSYGYTWKEY